jgi:hypothetical protein
MLVLTGITDSQVSNLRMMGKDELEAFCPGQLNKEMTLPFNTGFGVSRLRERGSIKSSKLTGPLVT